MSRWEKLAVWWSKYVTGAEDASEYRDYLHAQARLVHDLAQQSGLLVDTAIAPEASTLTVSLRRTPDDEPFQLTVEPSWWLIRAPEGFEGRESVDGPGETDLDPDWTQWYIDLATAFLDGSWSYVQLRAGILGRRRVRGMRIFVSDPDAYVELASDADSHAFMVTTSTGPR